MEQIAAVMQWSSLFEEGTPHSDENSDWSLDNILQSFPTEVCHMIAERRRLPTPRPVNIATSDMRLKEFLSILEGCHCPSELQNTLRKAYFKNTTFVLHAGQRLNVCSVRPTLEKFLDHIDRHVSDLTALRIEHFHFMVTLSMTPTRNGTSIEIDLQESWRGLKCDHRAFQKLANKMVVDAKSSIELQIRANCQKGISREQLEHLVKTVCKVEILRHIMQTLWPLGPGREVGESNVPSDEFMRDYAATVWTAIKVPIDRDSMDPWLFE